MKTKKILFVLLALFLICPVMHSQERVDQLFKEFTDRKGVEHLNMDSTIIRVAAFFSDLKGVDEIEIFYFDECDKSIKDKVNSAIASLTGTEDFEIMASVPVKGFQRVKVFMRVKDELITELVALRIGDSPVMLRIKGNIDPENFKELANKVSDK